MLDKNNDNAPTIDMEDLANTIAKKTGIEMKDVEIILESEMQFLSEKGLVSDEPSEESEEQITVDYNEMINFIASKTNITLSKVEKVLQEEDEYLIEKGIIVEN